MTHLAAAGAPKDGRSTQRLNNIQILRFVAAAMVVVVHLEHEAVRLGYASSDWMNWNGGVDIFFVISGFIMYLLSSKKFGLEGESWKFFSRRVIRIAPLYWIFTTLMLLAMLKLANHVDHSTVDVMHVIASYLFVPWVGADGSVKPILGVGWTLNYEMIFYVVFTFALLFRKVLGVALLCLLFCAAVVCGLWLPNASVLGFVTHPIILEFLFGVGLAALYLKGVRLRVVLAATLAVLGFALMAILHGAGMSEGDWRVVGAGLPALLIVSAFALAPNLESRSPISRSLILAGDASYALYLSHAFTLNVVFVVWRKLGLALPLAYIAMGLAVSVLVSTAVYLCLEKPLLNLVQSKAWLRLHIGRRRSVEA